LLVKANPDRCASAAALLDNTKVRDIFYKKRTILANSFEDVFKKFIVIFITNKFIINILSSYKSKFFRLFKTSDFKILFRYRQKKTAALVCAAAVSRIIS